MLDQKALTLTGRLALEINFTCDVWHTPTSFPRTAIAGIYVCSLKIDVARLFMDHEGYT